MTGYLLDTNVVSELRKGPRADRNVIAWFDAHESDELWLSVIVVAELRRGVARIARRDPAQAEPLELWLEGLIESYDDRILPISLGIALRWGGLGVPDPVPVLDGFIAATALEHRLTVVTRNVGDIARTGVATINPFD